MKRWMLYGAVVLVGAFAGWAYWNWYGCVSGCGITGRWWTSSAYGGVMAYLLMGMLLPNKNRTGGQKEEGGETKEDPRERDR